MRPAINQRPQKSRIRRVQRKCGFLFSGSSDFFQQFSVGSP